MIDYEFKDSKDKSPTLGELKTKLDEITSEFLTINKKLLNPDVPEEEKAKLKEKAKQLGIESDALQKKLAGIKGIETFFDIEYSPTFSPPPEEEKEKQFGEGDKKLSGGMNSGHSVYQGNPAKPLVFGDLHTKPLDETDVMKDHSSYAIDLGKIKFPLFYDGTPGAGKSAQQKSLSEILKQIKFSPPSHITEKYQSNPLWGEKYSYSPIYSLEKELSEELSLKINMPKKPTPIPQAEKVGKSKEIIPQKTEDIKTGKTEDKSSKMKKKAKPQKPKESEFKKKMIAYGRMEHFNDVALQGLVGLKEAIMQRDEDTTIDRYLQLVLDIKRMGEKFSIVKTQTHYQKFLKRLLEIEEQSAAGLEEILADFEKDELAERSFKLFEELKYEEDDDDDGCRFESCTTFHDLIRCLHGSGLGALFDDIGSSSEAEEYDQNNGEIIIIRETPKQHEEFIEAIKHIYAHNVQKCGSEIYKIIVSEKRLISRIRLGCHYSNIDLGQLSDGRWELKIKFFNTKPEQYSCAKNRENYVRRTLELMGYEGIVSNNNITDAVYTSNPGEDLNKTLRETVRMFASTKDLDLSLKEDKIEKAAQLFMGGLTYIQKKIGE